MSAPLFTIVTVALNAGEDLLETASTVDRQVDADYEHVVKDGGSRDGSIQRLPNHARRRVVARPDGGIYDAMNQSLEIAKGEYVLFLNAGDGLAHPSVLSEAADVIGRGGADVVYFDIQDSDRGAVIKYPDVLSDFFFYRAGICHQACLVKRALYQSHHGFDLRLPIAADHDFFVRAFRAGARFERVPFVLARYKGAGVSAAPKNRRALSRDIAAVRRKHYSVRERVINRILWEATLPHVRGLINRSPVLRPMRPLYALAINAFYGLTGAGRGGNGRKH